MIGKYSCQFQNENMELSLFEKLFHGKTNKQHQLGKQWIKQSKVGSYLNFIYLN